MRNLKLTVAVFGALLACAPSALAGSPLTHYEYHWRVNRVSRAYHTYGRWITCAQSGGGGDVGCSHSISVANTVSGQVGVSYGVISAAVGFSVTKSTTLTGSATYHVPRHHVWQAQYQAVFSTKAVHQRLWKRAWACVPRGACGPTSKWIPTNRYETAYASNFDFANFRHRQVR